MRSLSLVLVLVCVSLCVVTALWSKCKMTTNWCRSGDFKDVFWGKTKPTNEQTSNCARMLSLFYAQYEHGRSALEPKENCEQSRWSRKISKINERASETERKHLFSFECQSVDEEGIRISSLRCTQQTNKHTHAGTHTSTQSMYMMTFELLSYSVFI